MKFIQKLILPLLIIVIIYLIYSFYFADKGLGSFSDFDTNNTANKDIKVRVVLEKGINEDQQNGTASFYAIDKNGTEVLVQAPSPLPKNIRSLNEITLKGHLHPDHFHAVEVQTE